MVTFRVRLKGRVRVRLKLPLTRFIAGVCVHLYAERLHGTSSHDEASFVWTS